jgi:hypothetical protein
MEPTDLNSPGITLGLLLTDDEIAQVIDLMRRNHRNSLRPEQLSDGFVTAEYTAADLQGMRLVAPSVIARNERGEVVAYCLAKTPRTRAAVPMLEPIFQALEKASYQHRRLDSYRYLLIGQICVGEGYRGMGLVDRMYARLRQEYAGTFEMAVTEIARRNVRSLRAHQRVGFQVVHEAYDPAYDEVWVSVVWDWREGG